jgi:F-type H+-transporting ATPase subunit b
MQFNWWTFLFEIVNFAVLAYILHRLLYRPLRDAIDKRRQANALAQANAEKAHADAVAMQKQLQVQLTEMEGQRQKAIEEARELGEIERRKLLAEGEKTLKRRQQELRQAIEREHEEASRSLRAELRTSAVELAERLLREASGAALSRQLATHLVETLKQLPESQRAQMRRDWASADGAVIETAEPIDDSLLGQFTDAISAVVGQKVSLDVQHAPALVAGVRLRIGGHVWDASLAGQLEAPPSEAPGVKPYA